MGSLEFVLGTAAVDHQEVLVDQLADQLKNSPREDTFFYIVPNHIKFETEISVLAALRERSGRDKSARFASSRVQIFSFSRLAWYLLRDTPIFQQTRLSKVGLAMLITKITQEHADELNIYASEIHQPGFMQKLADQLTELQSANITADDFSDTIAKIKADENNSVSHAWLAKMHDIELIYHLYEERLTNYFLGNDELYKQLAQFLGNQENSGHMHFFIDRFTEFTAGEQQVVRAIILNAASTTIALTLDRGYPDQNHPDASELPDRNDLFYRPAIQYRRLWKLAASHPQQVRLAKNVLFADKLRVSPELAAVDRFFKRYAIEPLGFNRGEHFASNNLQFISSTNRLTELNDVATKIHQMVATGKYRYRDFLILTRHLDPYQTMLEPVFSAHHIPIFNDHERRMDQHPLVTLLTTLLNIPIYNYQSADIIQLLKTWLLLPKAPKDEKGHPLINVSDAVFTTENWCLMHGIEGRKAWTTTDQQTIDKLWRGKVPDQHSYSKRQKQVNDQLDLIRNFIGQTVIPFFDRLKKVQTGRELATVLYQFLVQNGVTDRLLSWQYYQANQEKNLDLAQQPKQVWATFCQILQEYVEILGDTDVHDAGWQDLLTTFNELLQSGFAAAQYSQIPATLDQVVISETGITQSQNHKVVFMIGSTDDVMPEMQENENLLTDSDKELLSQYLDSDAQYLPATSVEQLASEPFLNYQGFLSAQEKLILTVPQNNSDDQELKPSPYLVDMANYFQIDWEKMPLVTSLRGQQDAEQFISTPNATLSQLVQLIRQLKDNQGTEQAPMLPAGWRQVVNELRNVGKHNEQLAKRLDLLLGPSDTHKNDNLTKPMAEALYLPNRQGEEGRILYTSISQLERFYANQYEYFLKYGLRLQKREALSLSTDRIGTFFHKAMEEFIKLAQEQSHGGQLNLALLTQKENYSYLQHLINASLQIAQDQQPDLKRVINSAEQGSEQLKFQYRQLERIVEMMINTLCRQANYTSFIPYKTEREFKKVDYPFGDNNILRLRGRIDRIDKLSVNDQDYLTVVDYKSSDREFDLTSAYYGISLQLLSYLNALKYLKPNSGKLVGALYLHLFNPTINANKLARFAPANREKELQNLQLKQHQYKGVLLNPQNDDLLKRLDSSIGGDNFLYPFKNTRDGRVVGKKNEALLVSSEQFKWLLERNLHLIEEAGEKILNGEINLNPYRLIEGSNRRTGLDFSDYLDIYQFDNMLDQDHYHDLHAKTAQEKFENIDKKENQNKKEDK